MRASRSPMRAGSACSVFRVISACLAFLFRWIRRRRDDTPALRPAAGLRPPTECSDFWIAPRRTPLNRKPRARYAKQRHAFMGLLTCARCGCAMTAERKRGKYTYYRCTAFHGRCRNAYIREDRLADLLRAASSTISSCRVPADDSIAHRLRASQLDLEHVRERSSARLLNRQRALQAKIDRGCDDASDGSPKRCGRGNPPNTKRSSRPSPPNSAHSSGRRHRS
jgi:hypothetical protein